MALIARPGISRRDVSRAQRFRKGAFVLSRADVDRYDEVSDHILVEARSLKHLGKRILQATVRLRQGRYRPDVPFYSESEYELAPLFEAKPDIRKTGMGIGRFSTKQQSYLLPLAIMVAEDEYAQARGVTTVFGCSSFPDITTAEEASMAYAFAKDKGAVVKGLPLMKAKEPGRTDQFDPDHASPGKQMVPGLVKEYILLGARIIGEPFWDEEFGCFDFLTMSDYQESQKRFKRLRRRVEGRLKLDPLLSQDTTTPLWVR